MRTAPILLLAALPLLAQTDDPRAARVDALFADYARRDAPGYALAVVEDGKVILSRAYGMANLEHEVPLTPESVFDIGSTSKQFTAAAILMLERDGKLSLDDEVRKHIPELPAYDGPVTIRHLIHHTSGIRDYTLLMALSGLSFENDYTDEETLGWITAQKALNFEPGSEFLYSNSGYYLLSEIVKRVSGTSLRELAAKRIFEPLGMKNTHFHDDPAEVVKNRAISYVPSKNGWKIATSMYHVIGDGGVYTTVGDLAKWDANFRDPKVGGPEFLAAMLRRGKFNDGRESSYAAGLFHGDHKGLRTVGHDGGWAGYSSEYLRFPEQGYTFIVFSNHGAAGPMLRKIADVYLPAKEAAAEKREAAKSVALAPGELQKFAGLYFEPKNGFYRTVALRDGKLWYMRGEASGSELRPIAADRFEMVGTPQPAFVVFSKDGLAVESDAPEPVRLRRAEAHAPADLAAYAGEYRSEELVAPYRIRVKEGALLLRVGYGEERPLVARERDTFSAPLGLLRFERDASGKVTGFAISAARVRNVRFTRR